MAWGPEIEEWDEAGHQEDPEPGSVVSSTRIRAGARILDR
jgi:hypothetical protein